MASGFHPVGSREPLEILIRSHMTLGTPGEMSAAWHSKVDLQGVWLVTQNPGNTNKDGTQNPGNTNKDGKLGTIFSKDISMKQVTELLDPLDVVAKE